MPRPFLIVSQSDYLIQIVDIISHTKWQTVQIQISWLLQKPTDLDLHCLQRQGIFGFIRTKVRTLWVLCKPCYAQKDSYQTPRICRLFWAVVASIFSRVVGRFLRKTQVNQATIQTWSECATSWDQIARAGMLTGVCSSHFCHVVLLWPGSYILSLRTLFLAIRIVDSSRVLLISS